MKDLCQKFTENAQFISRKRKRIRKSRYLREGLRQAFQMPSKDYDRDSYLNMDHFIASEDNKYGLKD